MQKRIYRVLLVCSNYDFFMLEEDGRIEERIFNEYSSLSIRFPPVIIHTDSDAQALEIMAAEDIGLVVLMLNVGGSGAFGLARSIREKHTVPIVLLAHFSREVTMQLQHEDLACINNVFCWLGNADLLMAIIKLFEDEMNAPHDILDAGVQAIMLIEDSVRHISLILPELYKIVFRQSQNFSHEALNEHQRMLRLRGRPKILLATNYNAALACYNRYGSHILGVVSDVSFRKNTNSKTDTLQGIALCRHVRANDTFMPYLLQSSDAANARYALELDTGFVHKLSKSLAADLEAYILPNFGFGDLCFRDPETRQVLYRISDLAGLQQLILKLPDNVFMHHAGRNEISKWLNARALFGLGRLFRTLGLADFSSLAEARSYIYEAIARYRSSKGKGVIASFEKDSYSNYLTFSRMGEGSLGGKGRGLAFADMLIKKYSLAEKFAPAILSIPHALVVSTDFYDEFIETNNLLTIGLSNLPDSEILEYFVKAPLPSRLLEGLRHYIEKINRPVAIRSSSKLEDSHFQPFAGIFNTYMVPPVKDNPDKMAQMVAEAIKCVYASVFFAQSKAYIAATLNSAEDEKMAVIIQVVSGRENNGMYCPFIGGVARSVNFYPIGPEKTEDGVANIAYGLGRYIAEGGSGLRFSPKFPRNIFQLSTPELAISSSQKEFYALNMVPEAWHAATNDKVNILSLRTSDAISHQAFNMAASWYDYDNNCICETKPERGKAIISFSSVLQHNTFPLAEILDNLLALGQAEMKCPVEIEFSVEPDENSGKPAIFHLLQIRPIVAAGLSENVRISNAEIENAIIYSQAALGNGIYSNLADLVYVKEGVFRNAEGSKIAREIEKLNLNFKNTGRQYILAGSGRWGSSHNWLGIPVRWAQVSEAAVIVEQALVGVDIEPSQGAHFFQNLTAFKVGYITLAPQNTKSFFNYQKLANARVVFNGQYVCHVRFTQNLQVKFNGRKREAAICL